MKYLAILSILFTSGVLAVESSFPEQDMITAKYLTESMKTKIADDRDDAEKMSFVFEVVRHGARPPQEPLYDDFFTVSEGQLTPEGMRQRYLLGRYNRERYTEKFKFLSEEYNPDEFYIQSTDVNRTIQSGYSELMGLYPPKKSGAPKLTQGMIANFDQDIAMPPFKVRDAKKINSQLGFAALPDDFTAVAILLFDNQDIHDDASTDGCTWINEVNHPREEDPTVWKKYEQMRADTRDSVKNSLNLTDSQADDVSFHTYYHYTDQIVAIDFEGTKQLHRDFFTDDLWLEANEIQRVFLTDWFTKGTRDLMNSRMLRKPLEIMQQKVDKKLGLDANERKEEGIKFMIYSSHDTQVDNMMVFLTQNKTSFTYIPYASQVIFELKYDEKCVKKTPSEACFGVGINFNGNPQTFPGCTGDGFGTTGCKYEEFKKYIASIWYSGPHADDLDAACQQPVQD